ncbi:MAG: AsmA-like C-terminal region-containing protein [Gemmataceae bacterium]
MSWWTRWRRRLLVLAALFAVLLGGIHWYLGSRSGARLVARDLGELLKTHASIDRLRAGFFGNTKVLGLNLQDSRYPDPYLTARQVEVDLSISKILAGARLPSQITVDDVSLHLRFDRDGKLLTELPHLPNSGRLPRLRLRNLTLTLDQEGRPPFTLHRGELTLNPENTENLSGDLKDPEYGNFEVAGRFAEGKLHLRLNSTSLPLSLDRFHRIPFIPLAVKRHLEVAGDGPLQLELWLGKESPKARYRVAIQRATVHLLQPERAPFIVAGVDGTIEGTDRAFQLRGSAKNHTWGDWELSADMVEGVPAVDVRLKGSETAFTPEMLADLPYVPPHVWKQVSGEGLARVNLQVTIPTKAGPPLYRAEVQIRETRTHINSIDLHANKVHGSVIVENHRVTLQELRGQSAGGAIIASGDLNFRQQPPDLRFDIEVNGLHVAQLPERWQIPRALQGLLHGQAHLRLVLRDDGLQTNGRGSGRIEKATIAGFPTQEPIRLTLQGDGQRIRLIPAGRLFQLLQGFSLENAHPADPLVPHKLPMEVIRRVSQETEETLLLAGSLLTQFAQWTNPSRDETYLRTQFRLRNADIAELAPLFGIPAPVDLVGKASLDVDLDIPVNHLRDLRHYRLEARLISGDLHVSGVPMRHARGRLTLARGLLKLEGFRAETGEAEEPGSLEGHGTIRFTDATGQQGHLEVETHFQNCPLGRLVRFLPSTPHPAGGKVTGRLKVQVPLNDRGNPARWIASAQLFLPQFEAAGFIFRQVGTRMTLERGILQFSEIQGELLSGVARANLELSLVEDQAVQGSFQLRGLDASALAQSFQLPEVPRGSFHLSGEVAGKLKNRDIVAKGTLRAGPLSIRGHGIAPLSLNWSLDREQLAWKELNARFHGGTLTGWGHYRFMQRSGQTEWFLNGLEGSKLAEALGSSGSRIEGTCSGQASCTLRPGETGPLLQVQADLTSPQLSFMGVQARNLRGKLDHSAGRTQYRLSGETLSGRLSLEGSYPPRPATPEKQPHGTLRLESGQFSKLAESLGIEDKWGAVEGTLAIDLPFQHDAETGIPRGQGRFEVRNLQWRKQELIELLRGDFSLRDNSLSIRDLNGPIAGGNLRFSSGIRFTANPRGWFDLRLLGVEPNRCLPLTIDGKPAVQGAMDMNLRGTWGAECRASGNLALSRGKVAGIEVNNWRVPIDGTWIPERRHLEIDIRDSAFQLGQGRAQLRMNLRQSDSLVIEGQMVLFDAAMRSLVGILGEASSLARGRVTGRVDFSGSDVRTIDDITANVQAKLNDAQALQLPVLRLIVPHVVPGQGAAEFQAGELKGRLSEGVFRISEMTLESSLILLLVQGSVTRHGRLDLDVMAQTSSPTINPVLLRSILLRLPPVGPIPVVLVFRATEIMADRIIHMRITGTVGTPRVNVEPVRLLSEQAVRFFLNKAAKATAP